LTHALGQLAEWRAWFDRGHNHTAFLEYYDIPPEMARRKLEPRYVLVHGRRDNFESIPRRREKRAALAKPDERLMSFDRLTPAKNSVRYSTVRKGQDGYRVTSVPPCLTIFNTGQDYRLISGWRSALDSCPDMAAGRRDYLKEQLDLLTSNPSAYVTSTGKLRTLPFSVALTPSSANRDRPVAPLTGGAGSSGPAGRVVSPCVATCWSRPWLG
jgi:hypothetical protein